jgi:hypothetical protein
MGVSFFLSVIVGAAACLAIIDDAGKREMTGLAASAQNRTCSGMVWNLFDFHISIINFWKIY